MSARLVSSSIHVSVKLSLTVCCDIQLSGLCGFCPACKDASGPTSQCPLQDTTSEPPTTPSISRNMTQDDIHSYIDNNTVVPDDVPPAQVDDVFQLPEISSGSHGNCLCFQNSSMTSRNLKLFKNRYTSLQFYVKTCIDPRCHGTLLSYSNKNTFGIVHEGTIKIGLGAELLDTGLSFSDRVWDMVTIVVDKKGHTVYIYLYKTTGELLSRYITSFFSTRSSLI